VAIRKCVFVDSIPASDVQTYSKTDRRTHASTVAITVCYSTVIATVKCFLKMSDLHF